MELTNEIRAIRGIDARGGVCIALIHSEDSRFAATHPPSPSASLVLYGATLNNKC